MAGRFNNSLSKMSRNVEIKASVLKLSELIEKAKQLSKSEGEIIPQHDTFYKIAQGRLKMRQFENGSAELIFYERQDVEGPKLSNYDKCVIPKDTVGGLMNVLNMALGVSGVVKKTRNLFMVEQTRIHIDSVEQLGDFMELEVGLQPSQSVKEGEEIANDLMKKLGIDESQLLACAYTDLLNS